MRFIEDSYYNADSGWDFGFVTDPEDILSYLPKTNISIENNSGLKPDVVTDNSKTPTKPSIKSLNLKSSNIIEKSTVNISKEDKKSGLLA